LKKLIFFNPNFTTYQPRETKMTEQKTQVPTVVAAEPYDAESDAQVLYKAMKGFGTDEKAIISVVGNRTTKQLKAVEEKFKTAYGKDLQKWLKSELGGKFEDIVIARFYDTAEFQAKCLREAMKGLGTNERTLIDVLCTKTNEEIEAIKTAFTKMYSRDLEKDVKSETGGDFERILVSLIQGKRETGPANQALADKEADELYAAGEGKTGTDEAVFNRILCLRSQDHLRAVFAAYLKNQGHDLGHAIKKEFSGDTERAFLTVFRSIQDQTGYWAQVLYESMKGLGTDDRTLVRTIADRCEIDLGNIKQEYTKKYGKTLEKAVASETKGDYERMMLSVIGTGE